VPSNARAIPTTAGGRCSRSPITAATLLAHCANAARDLDAEITAGLTAAERRALHNGLGVLAERAGLPTA